MTASLNEAWFWCRIWDTRANRDIRKPHPRAGEATMPTPTDITEAACFIEAAKGWLDDVEGAEKLGFDAHGSAVMMLDRALEFLRGEGGH